MKLSARNVIKGKVVKIDVGAVNAEITVELAPSVVITSIITKQSMQNLNLAEGKDAYVAIKASDVMIGVEDGSVKNSVST
jgi:molybdate transport system regulatory protein